MVKNDKKKKLNSKFSDETLKKPIPILKPSDLGYREDNMPKFVRDQIEK